MPLRLKTLIFPVPTGLLDVKVGQLYLGGRTILTALIFYGDVSVQRFTRI